MHRLRTVALALALTALLAGCSGDGDEQADDNATPQETATAGKDGKKGGKLDPEKAWELPEGSDLNDRTVNYVAVCVQWETFQEQDVPWVSDIEENAEASGNKLAQRAVAAVNADVADGGEVGDEAAALMDELCADVDY